MDIFSAVFYLVVFLIFLVILAVTHRGKQAFLSALGRDFNEIILPLIIIASVPFGFAEIVNRFIGPLSDLVYKIAFYIGFIPGVCVMAVLHHESESERESDSLRKELSIWKNDYMTAKSKLDHAVSLMTYDQLVSLNGELWAHNYSQHHKVEGAPSSDAQMAKNQ